jgi:hypothetical protein
MGGGKTAISTSSFLKLFLVENEENGVVHK